VTSKRSGYSLLLLTSAYCCLLSGENVASDNMWYHNKEIVLARKTNYSYEKRQKELAKKKKKEEKRQRKLEKKKNPDAERNTIPPEEE
jgi:hypothetical protein